MYPLRGRAVRTLLIVLAFATLLGRGEGRAAQLTVNWENPTSGDQSRFYVEGAAGSTEGFTRIAATAAKFSDKCGPVKKGWRSR